MSTIIPFTSTDNWPIWRNTLNSNFQALNTDLVSAETDISNMEAIFIDASTDNKWFTKLSTSPASPTEPIAVWDNDSRIPTQDENNALSGTWTPSSSNKFVTEADPEYASLMKVTWTQTVGGVKTFTSIPVLPWVPTTDNELATKSYVDSLF